MTDLSPPPPAPSDRVRYANWWSKVFCGDAFDRQFFIPVPPPALLRLALEAVEAWRYPASRLAHLKVERPVFIVGLPRSGTTMLYNLLCAHPEAAYINNSMNVYPRAMVTIDRLRVALRLNIQGERYLKDSVITDFGGPSELMSAWGRWTGRAAEDTNWEDHPLEVTEAMRAQAVEDFQRALFVRPGSRVVIAKNPVLQTDLLAIQELFPDARFVHIVRDGRQAANSLAKLYRLNNSQLLKIQHPLLRSIVPYPRLSQLSAWMEAYGPDSLDTTARVWDQSLALVRRTRPALRHFHELRYEDLLAAPEAQTRELLDFCGLPWPGEGASAFHEQLQGVGVIHHRNDYGDFERIERIAGEGLRAHGYL